MKKTITLILFTMSLCLNAQILITDFDDLTLNPGSFYKDTTGADFSTYHAEFAYEWTGGAFPFWSGGFSYTNKYDSSTAGYTNLYGVRAYKGFNGSDKYVIGQNAGIIKMKYQQTSVQGFYYTNTTYAFKSIKNGDMFARKFGDTTGTGSGTTIAQGDYPDYFKIILRAYLNGQLKNDSVEIFLADFRSGNSAADFIVDDWRFVNTSSLGELDSLRFDMRSSDNSQWGMNTPGFFAIDNFVTYNAILAGVSENGIPGFNVYPQPADDFLNLDLPGMFSYSIADISGRYVTTGISENHTSIGLTDFAAGVYVLSIRQENQILNRKIIIR